ncbi:hypothetical protein [Clostridiisalibacter paucivorans]|uniref:hypothetical protein n=1 Tax=Clostridiisalibacter paucivorans TaxID=408753 RepID=UPI00047E9DAA|nr:hypothetical protein [Clostridiisalibacter paucivorans]
MLSLFRRAPKILLFESNNMFLFEKVLLEDLNGIKCTFNEAFDISDDKSTIVLLVKKLTEVVKDPDVDSVILVKMQSDILLSKIINHKKSNLISKMRIAPIMLIMRSFGNIDKVINEIRKKHQQAVIGNSYDLWQKYNFGTIVSFTQKPLHRVLSLSQLHKNSLYIKEDYVKVIYEFSINSLKYLNAGIDNKDWYEIEIKIYDKFSRYDIHYKRLVDIIQNLELGLILGESWGKDNALFLLHVDIYRIRLFTLYNPEYIKKILVGLEHLDNGNRIVDYDLFYKRKKIHWTDILENRKTDRGEFGKKIRKEIIEQLSKKEAHLLFDQEAKIIESQNK